MILAFPLFVKQKGYKRRLFFIFMHISPHRAPLHGVFMHYVDSTLCVLNTAGLRPFQYNGTILRMTESLTAKSIIFSAFVSGWLLERFRQNKKTRLLSSRRRNASFYV